ncbi:MAG: glycoside hydrolase family 3 C-terminal domain-containing protein [Acidobacteriota bacterium]|nr:glycoside hydrolase family 3 C-terminal domain-containing protein [Acidobacteriota bacterium]
MSSQRIGRVLVTVVATTAVALGGSVANAGSAVASRHRHAKPQRHFAATKCPWTSAAQLAHLTPDQLAHEVLAKMTLLEKARFVVLNTRAPLGNTNGGDARLCLPPLTLSDGPVGLANGLPGVTQWPAEIALAATFSTRLATLYGRALGAETRAKGLDAIQAPNLNLTRVALSGRTFETFGEDPYLAGSLGASEIRGIQSQGTMSDVKHFGAYTQEIARLHLNQRVGARTLDELYLAPFRQAVIQSHPASVMCAYGAINGVNTCADATLVRELRRWGFAGFIRSDLHAALNVAASLRAGVDLLKPTSATGLVHLVRRRAVSLRQLNRAVVAVLTTMFRFRLVAPPRVFAPYRSVATFADVTLARRVAESAIVLLKNNSRLLPLSARDTPLAVIGLDANVAPIVAGGGSSAVLSPPFTTPLAALRATFGAANVTYARGSTNASDLDLLGDASFLRGRPFLNGRPLDVGVEPGKADLAIQFSPHVTPVVATATRPLRGPGWNRETLHLETSRAGVYELAVQQYGDTWVYLNGHAVLASPGLHARDVISSSVELRRHRRYTVTVRWFNIRDHQAPRLGVLDASARINAAVRAARRARVAIVFASSYSAEGADRPNLQLPGDQNALIAAVARANPRTVVVLNTGGAVAMPWLPRVAAVLEAWYPGQSDGPAIAAVLRGAVNPSGRLPLTFPRSMARSNTSTPSTYPGVNEVVRFGSVRDLGYRWYQSHDVRPLFPFGFGLSYTTFASTRLHVQSQHSRLVGQVTLTNTGARSGVDVVEVYLHYPRSTGEPPEQLKAFVRVALAPHARRRVTFVIPRAELTIYPGGVARVVPGLYRLEVGSSSADLTLHARVRIS